MDWITVVQITLFGILIAQIVAWVLNKQKARKKDAPFQPPPPLPGPMTEIERQWLVQTDAQVRALARAGLAGMAVIGSEPGPLETRVGGPLIVPKGKEAPTNQFGKPLLPLLLLRLSDLPQTEGNVLPKRGWIQVLIEPDDPLDIPVPAPQGAGFRLIHFREETEFDVYPVDPSGEGLDLIWDSVTEGDGVMETGFSIEFELVNDIAPNTHHKLDSLPDGRHTKEFNDAFDKQYYALEDERVRCDVMIGGQAVFTQDDIRY